jgi:hypothetical protein
MKLEFFRFLKDAKISDFLKICPLRTELFHANAWTYVAKVMVAFRNFATTLKNYSSHWSWRRACCSIMVVGCEACGRNVNICHGSYWWPIWKSEEFTHFLGPKIVGSLFGQGVMLLCWQCPTVHGTGAHGATDSELSAKARVYHLLVQFTFLAPSDFRGSRLEGILMGVSFHLQWRRQAWYCYILAGGKQV